MDNPNFVERLLSVPCGTYKVNGFTIEVDHLDDQYSTVTLKTLFRSKDILIPLEDANIDIRDVSVNCYVWPFFWFCVRLEDKTRLLCKLATMVDNLLLLISVGEIK